jgi:diaminohydroxyphosphoribosylaminopyrimidine deaminase/5-amino-6-(5-phosphoribosylamino)uracil reductase
MQRGRPWVRIKLAMSLDGRTALANGTSQWITGESSRADVQLWRARSSAILTGVGTVLADDPRLSVRAGGENSQPLRVVLDSQLKTPPVARILAQVGKVLIFTMSDDAGRRRALEAQGATVERVAGNQLALGPVLARLAALEVNELLVEAGPTLAGAIVQANLADELLIYIAPVLFGPQARPLLNLPALDSIAAARRLVIVESAPVGADVRLRLRPT